MLPIRSSCRFLLSACLLYGEHITLLEIEKGRRFFGLSKPTKRRPNICDSFSAMMPLFLREKSSLKGRWRLETVQDMRSSSSNPVSCSETPIKIYGSKEEIRARKSPETVDAPGFAPDASIPITLYGGGGGSRTRVRKHFNRTFSGRSQDLNIPSAQGHLTDLTLQ